MATRGTPTARPSQVLRSYNHNLVTAISAANQLSLATKLYSKKLIGKGARDTVTKQVYNHQHRAHVIVSAVEKSVEADPSLFHQFTTLLLEEGDDGLKSLGEKLISGPSTESPIRSHIHCEILQEYYKKLVTAISAADPLSLAISLYSKKLIEEDTRDTIATREYSAQHDAAVLVNAVERKVESNPSLFSQFTAVLGDEDAVQLRSLSKELIAETQNVEQEHRYQQDSSTDQSRSPTFLQDYLYQQFRMHMLFSALSHAYDFDTQESALCLYSNKLRMIYIQSELPEHTDPTWTPSLINEFNIFDKKVEQYITTTNLQLQFDPSICLTSFEEFLEEGPDEQLKCVLVEGAPGIGKSVLAWHVCHCWGNEELFHQYSTVLLLPLRDHRVQGATCVEDLFVTTDEKFHERIRSEVTKNNWDGESTLIILDGLDELPSHLLSQPSIFTALLSGEALSQATILITSRPSATEQLLNNQQVKISRHFQLRGFTQKSIAQCAYRILSDRTQFSGFSKYLSHTPNIWSTLHVPLHCIIAATVYSQCHQSCKPLPKTLSELYIYFILIILNQYLGEHPQHAAKDGGDTIFGLQLPYLVYSYFKELCRIAFEHVCDQKLVFSDLPKELHDLGFTDAVPELSLSQQSVNYSYNFLHLSVQEFLAAYHISLMSHSEHEHLLKTKFYESHFQNMFRYLAGITKFNGLSKIVLREVLSVHQNSSKSAVSDTTPAATEIVYLDDYKLEVLYECQDISFLDSKSTYGVKFCNPSHHHCLALGHCITNSKGKWKLELEFCNKALQAEMIHQGMKESQSCHASYSVSFEKCSTEFTDRLLSQHASERKFVANIESLSLLGSFLHIQGQIPTLILHEHPLPPCIPELIPTMDKLNSLTLNKIHDDSLSDLLSVLSAVPTLRTLELSNCQMNSESITLLRQWLPTCQLETLRIPSLSSKQIKIVSRALKKSHACTLKLLDIRGSKLSIYSMVDFACMLQQNRSLTELNISRCNIYSEIACYLPEVLYHNTTLKKLDMSDNRVKEGGLVTMADMLKHNTTLEDLNLRNMEIGSDDVVAMATALHHNTTLRRLDMSRNSVGERGALAMAEMIKHNTTLEELDLISEDLLNLFYRFGVHDSNISDKGIKGLVESLATNQHLKKLTINEKYREFVQSLSLYQDHKERIVFLRR